MSEPHDALVTMWTTGDADARREALEHVQHCDACRAAAPKLGVALDALEGGTVGRSPLPAPAGGLSRLLSRARATHRVTYFTPQVAALFDLSTEAAAALLARVERNEWDGEMSPGVELIAFEGGPRVQGAMVGLVKVAPHAEFPLHPHPGRERVLVLEGGYIDSQGVEKWRGEEQPMAAGTEHSFTALDVGCVCASVVFVDSE